MDAEGLKGNIPHRSTTRYFITAAVGGTCVKVRKTMNGHVVLGGGCRGEVRGFSRRSRKRLLDWLNSIPRSQTQGGLFITLTYHLKWGETFEDWKRDLDTFFKRLRRKFPKVIAVWKLELQKRGAPHFHLLVFGVPFIAHQWLASAWNEIVDPGNAAHLAAGTEVRSIRSFGGVIHYAVKYISKIDDSLEPLHTGRIWGIVGRQNIEVLWFTVELSRGEHDRIKRVLRRWVSRKLRRRNWRAPPGGLTAYLTIEVALRLLEWAQRDADAVKGSPPQGVGAYVKAGRAASTRRV
jgi:hypothetical protein